MKRKNIVLVMLLVLTGLFTMQSCKKDSVPDPVMYFAAVPAKPVPGNLAVIPFSGAAFTQTLKWDIGTPSATTKWTVYFGKSEKPAKVASDVAGNTYDVSIKANEGGAYYWYVETVDANNVKSTSPVWEFIVNSNPTVPVLTPNDAAVSVSNAVALTWTTSDPEHDDLTYDLYLGKTNTPAVVASGLTDATYSPTLTPLTTYYWKVIVKDPYGGQAASALQSFTTGPDPISAFVADYNVDENSVQNGNYQYQCTFTKVNSTTIKADNWWDSGWAAEFEINFAKSTIVMKPFTYATATNTYLCTGSGKVDLATGKISLVYSITKNGVLLENGVDDFVKAKGGSGRGYIKTNPKM